MILGMEIGLLVYGIIILAKGKMSASKTKAVYGGRARILGVLCVLPLPLAFAIGIFVGASAAAAGRPPDAVALTLVEAGLVLGMGLLVVVMGMAWAEPIRQEGAGFGGGRAYGFPVQPLPPAGPYDGPPAPGGIHQGGQGSQGADGSADERK